MAEYLISHVLPNDTSTLAQIDELLFEEGITRDKNLDYICVMYDEDYHVIATGSCFGHTLRCCADLCVEKKMRISSLKLDVN